MTCKKENIVLFPFMAQGHIIPFIALTLKLEQNSGHTIVFVNTPLNIKKIQPSIPPNSNIRLLEIPYDSSDHGLPPNSETTENLPLPLMLRLIVSASSLRPAFENLISTLTNEQHGRPPLCIISDMFFGWTAEIAHDFGTFHAIFNAGGSYGMALFHSLWLNQPHKSAKFDQFSLPGFPNSCRFRLKQLPEDIKSATAPVEFIQAMFREWKETDAMLFNTLEELEHIGLMYFRQEFRCPIWPIGPILSPVGSKARAGTEAEMTTNLCLKWLDTKPLNSVLYVAFGSQTTPSESQTKELATALEVSEKSFIWVIRPPSSFIAISCDDKDEKEDEEEEWLPEGFEQRIREKNKGLLVKNWAPQMEILSHKSIGAFLSHCGWNSVLEALCSGVPILSWPMGAEQPYNAKMLEEEKGISIQVASGKECEVRHEDIVQKIEMVMNETKEAKEMRRKACEVKEMMIRSSSSVKSIDEFLDTALQMRKILSRSPKECTLGMHYPLEIPFS